MGIDVTPNGKILVTSSTDLYYLHKYNLLIIKKKIMLLKFRFIN